MKKAAFLLVLLTALRTFSAPDRSAFPPLFERAAAEFGVPADVLKGIAFAETRWAHLTWAPGDTRSCLGMPRPYGVMSLWEDEAFGRTLLQAAALIGQEPETLKRDPGQNIRGAAALLRRLYDELPLPEGTTRAGLESWRNAIAAYCGIPQPDLAHQHALDVFAHINRGYHRHGIEWNGRPVKLQPVRDAVEKIKQAEAAKRAAVSPKAQPDYPGAIWRPAYPGHWYTSGYARAFVVIHDIEGYYLSTISYIQRSTTQVSIHYLVNGKTDYVGDAPPGEITQMVEERYWAWHVRCWNLYMLGIEHEGFANDPAWFTEELYQASAQLTRYLCDKYGIPKDRNHIIAHGEWQNTAWRNWMAANWPQIDTACNDHWDPGPHWDWDHYMALVIGEVNDAACGGVSVPATVAPGQSFSARVTLQNTGTKPWTSDATPHRLGSQNPQDNTRWGLSRVALPASPVNPGGSATFTFTATAPLTPGTYAFDWRMVEDGVEWFGPTCTATITVAWPPPAITNQPQSVTVNPGQTATFTVGAGGTAPLSYRWRRNGVNLSNDGRITGAHSATLTISNAQLADAGFYSVLVSNASGATLSQEAQLVVTTAPAPAGTGTGLRAWVFDNADFTSLKRARIDATVNFDWGTNSPSSTTDPDTFSVRWQGQVEPRYSQTYTFHTLTDDGVRLWVNGVLLIDRWTNQSATEWSGSLELEAGRKYDLRMDYYENTGPAVAQLRWSSPSQIKEIIPQTQLHRPPPALAAVSNRMAAPGHPISFVVVATNWDPFLSAQPITDFEDFADATPVGTVMFRAPSYSGSTDQFLDPAETNYTTVEAAVPAGNSSARVLKARWAFAPNATNPWLRLTTAAAANLPNPTIDFTRALWFDLYADREVGVAFGARETGTSAALGADGGMTGDIEFVGVTGTTNGAPVPYRTVRAGSWTTLQFDIPREPVRPFTGNGMLESPTGKGTIEHLAIVPRAGAGVYRVYLDNFVVVQHNRLAFSLEPGAPAGAAIDPVTGVFTWTPGLDQAPGAYDITVRVTDGGSPAASATTTFGVTVTGRLVVGRLAVSNATATISWPAVVGQTYRVQFKERLDDAAWRDLAAVTATGTNASFAHSIGAGAALLPQRFYRVVLRD